MLDRVLEHLSEIEFVELHHMHILSEELHLLDLVCHDKDLSKVMCCFQTQHNNTMRTYQDTRTHILLSMLEINQLDRIVNKDRMLAK